MIDFRYHIVSLVAVFLALALGLFLGSTTLQSTVTHSLQQQADHVTAENNKDETLIGQLNAQNHAEQGFDAAVEPYVVAGKLINTSIAVVSAPGVDSGDRTQLISTLTDAGATVTADVRLPSGFLDPNQDATWGQLAAQLAGSRPLPKTNGAGQAAVELARALVSRPGAAQLTSQRIETILGTFSDGNMITVAGQAPVHGADLAVLLVPLGPSANGPTPLLSQNDDMLALTQALRRGSSGLVVAAPTPTQTSTGGVIAAVRADPTLPTIVSTVDGFDTAAGRIAIALALAAAPSGTVGQYGLAGHEAPLPSQSPAP